MWIPTSTYGAIGIYNVSSLGSSQCLKAARSASPRSIVSASTTFVACVRRCGCIGCGGAMPFGGVAADKLSASDYTSASGSNPPSPDSFAPPRSP